MAVALSLLGVAVSAVMFAAATRDERAREESVPIGLATLSDEHFFADDRVHAGRSAVPIEALRLQIERHVRLEQAAAEAFHQMPTHEALHVQTMSPLVH